MARDNEESEDDNNDRWISTVYPLTYQSEIPTDERSKTVLSLLNNIDYLIRALRYVLTRYLHTIDWHDPNNNTDFRTVSDFLKEITRLRGVYYEIYPDEVIDMENEEIVGTDRRLDLCASEFNDLKMIYTQLQGIRLVCIQIKELNKLMKD